VTYRQPDPAPGAEPERGFLVAVLAQGTDSSGEIAELGDLARTAGVDPVGTLVQHRSGPDPRTYVGKGKLEELKHAYASSAAESLLVDDELTPPQQRNLENALSARVVDRTQLILDIFAQHARSAEGKLQVELAQLEYNLPRMPRLWQHLERLGVAATLSIASGALLVALASVTTNFVNIYVSALAWKTLVPGTSDAWSVWSIGGVGTALGLVGGAWLDGYAGGLFVPFADATSGSATYGGGRYALDTAKGADLGTDGDRIVLDFNFAYPPSCAYDPRGVCPLAPPPNRLAPPIRPCRWTKCA